MQLNSFCNYLLLTINRKGWFEKDKKLPPGVIISKEKLPDGNTPIFFRMNSRGGDYFFIEFGHKQHNVRHNASLISEFIYCSPCVIIADRKHIWLEPDPPKIISYAGNEWVKDAPNFREWIIKSGNRGFEFGHMLAPVDGLIGEAISIMEKAVWRCASQVKNWI
ncbi:MAG: hypothetical protein WCV70_04460 [Patescibacteria group bacterium]